MSVLWVSIPSGESGLEQRELAPVRGWANKTEEFSIGVGVRAQKDSLARHCGDPFREEGGKCS